MSGPFEARKIAAMVRETYGLPAIVAAVIDDGEGGVFIQMAVEDMTLEDAERVAALVLRDLRRVMAEDEANLCDACARQFARVSEALAILERDGHKPTGQARTVQ